MYPEAKIYPCSGAPIYLEDEDKLYAGTTWGNQIYIFENVSNKSDTEHLPEKVWTIEKEKVAYMYNPVRYGQYIYWGCYHSDKTAGAKIIKFDITSDTTTIINFNQIELANYTHSLAISGNYLFAGTENGHIIKYFYHHWS